eukprot:2629986-Rhodomonas_salina.2
MSGTEAAYAANRYAMAIAVSGSTKRELVSYRPTHCPVLTSRSVCCCSVLTWRMLPSAYAMSGTDIAYAATGRQVRVRSDGRARDQRHFPSAYALATRCPVLTWRDQTHFRLCSVRCHHKETEWETAINHFSYAISLSVCYAMSGTDTGYDVLSPYACAARCPVLTLRMLLAPLPAYARATPCQVLTTPYAVLPGASKTRSRGQRSGSTVLCYGTGCGAGSGTLYSLLRACYAVSGTAYALSGTVLRACYAMSGTAYALSSTVLRACYAMAGTERGYAATRRNPSFNHLAPSRGSTEPYRPTRLLRDVRC